MNRPPPNPSYQRPVSLNDWDLVQQARGGDRAAFRVLVERYQGKIAGLALGILRSRDDALDIVQETFVKAYQNLARFKGESGFYTWVYRIAYNLCIDAQRRETKIAAVPLPTTEKGEEAMLGAPEGPAPDQPFEHAQSAEVGARVKQAIAELTPEHQAVILLREVDGLSYEEISEVIGCPKGTVMSRLHYARQLLRARLKELR